MFRGTKSTLTRVTGLFVISLLALYVVMSHRAPLLAAASVPEFAVSISGGGWAAYGSASFTQTSASQYVIDTPVLRATISDLGDNRWSLQITQAKQTLSAVYFPWQSSRSPLDADVSNDLYYFPFLLGRTEKATNRNADWTWWGMKYPGGATAPLVVMADANSAKIVAATNWPPRAVTPLYSAQRMVLRYDTPIRVGESATFGALIATVTGNATIGDPPWQKALDAYRSWLDSAMGTVTYPSWMWDGQGLLDLQLEGFGSLAAIDSVWQTNKARYPWLLMWGQMSPQGGGCCGIDPTTGKYYAEPKAMNTRWVSAGLSTWTQAQVSAGHHAGYYSAPYLSYYGTPAGSPSSGSLDSAGGLDWLTSWTALNISFQANSHYIDVFAREHFGDPAAIVSLFSAGTLPRDAMSEGIADVYPIPGLVSGSLAGGSLCGAPHKRPETQVLTTYPQFVRYLLGDRLMYWGWQNDDNQFWGTRTRSGCDYATYCADGRCDYGVERQILLTGARIALGSGAANAVLNAIVTERQRVNWWSRRPHYLGTRGLNLAGIPEASRVEVTRFQDGNGADLLAISNPKATTGLSFSLNGVTIAVPAQAVAIIDRGTTRPSAPTNVRIIPPGM
jgi:hypothetical protein